MSNLNEFVIVTGAAGGIGQAIVREFMDGGYSVIAVDFKSKPININPHFYLEVDLGKTVQDEVYALTIFEEIKKIIGGDSLKGLINNAAIQILGGIDDLSRSKWQETLNVNLMAPFIWTQALISNLESSHGSVVNISSIHATLTKKNFVAYATSKAALSGMTRALAVDVGPRIRINAIEPAAIETDMLKDGFRNSPSSFSELNEIHPFGRIGMPCEVASLCRMLIVDKNLAFMHGSVVAIDGGIGSTLNDPKR